MHVESEMPDTRTQRNVLRRTGRMCPEYHRGCKNHYLLDNAFPSEWNQRIIISTKTQRRAGRLAKRWEDNLNDFVIDEVTEATHSNDLKNNNTWVVTAMNNIHEWEKKERHYAEHVIDD